LLLPLSTSESPNTKKARAHSDGLASKSKPTTTASAAARRWLPTSEWDGEAAALVIVRTNDRGDWSFGFMHIVDTCGSRVYVASVARGSHGEAAEPSHQMRRN
jgi:hypothetical protein